MKENTGNFRVCRQQIGIGGSVELLFEFKDKNDAIKKMREINNEATWNYYCEEEVIYKGTQFDANNNPINSIPTWVRI
jgi:hypothetical protein